MCYANYYLYNRGVNRAEISGPARKFFTARPGINVLQKNYNF